MNTTKTEEFQKRADRTEAQLAARIREMQAANTLTMANSASQQLEIYSRCSAANTAKRLLNGNDENLGKRVRTDQWEYEQSDVESEQYQSDSEYERDSQHNDQEEEEEEIDIDVDPNVSTPAVDGNVATQSGEPERQDNTTYPAYGSSPEIWILPSGLSVAEAICPPNSLPKAHPSHMGIIRVGANIRRPEWIQQADWRYLQSSVAIDTDPPSDPIQDFFRNLSRTKRKSDKQLSFYLDVLGWFATTVFNPVSTFRSPRAQESALGSLLLHPVLMYLANASANRRLVRRHLKPESDKPQGIKVDGIFQSLGGLEMGFVEISGGHQTNDQPRYLKDHVRGFRGQRDLLDDAAAKLAAGEYHIMRHLRMWFLHTHGLDVQIWGMDLPVKRVYRMFLLGTFKFPIHWEDHDQLLRGLPILWALAMGLEISLNTLDKLKKSNRVRGVGQIKKSVSLTNYVGIKMDTPTKPKGKKSRTIKPMREGSSSPLEESAFSDQS
ncbi:hypothetical protein BC936DRAFT_148910 [Jimgerdemannia flammicorona]|uniref:Uncharacterized protein n=1 Tax=Jimgerdemannia flammicorona TaxID=994334 RepID=A0A433D217_9FUNG|nr:hypothetical protein BC936DRAFT_148910 [Jimgerdemannia flammicorona]